MNWCSKTPQCPLPSIKLVPKSVDVADFRRGSGMMAQREPWHTRVQAVPEPWCPSLTGSEAVLGMASGCPIAHMRGVWCWKPSFSLSSTLWVGGKEIRSNVGRKEILMGEGCRSLGEATLTTSSNLAHSPAHWLSPEGKRLGWKEEQGQLLLTSLPFRFLYLPSILLSVPSSVVLHSTSGIYPVLSTR